MTAFLYAVCWFMAGAMFAMAVGQLILYGSVMLAVGNLLIGVMNVLAAINLRSTWEV